MQHLGGLDYPWDTRVAPKFGEPIEVARGVYWVRFPLMIELDHINIWLLEDRDGWTVVDTCFNTVDARTIWEELFSGFMDGKPVVRVICTHMHPDHVGLAGWLTRRFDCNLWMSREEFMMCRTLVADTGRSTPEVALRFYRAAGYNEDQLADYARKFGGFGRYVSALPDSFRRLVDRETITIGEHYWQVIMGAGHSPEHACLYCPGLKLLISGDQVLPKITPNVSVFPTEPYGDPLAEWLKSSARIRDILPDDVLVLPSHGFPFYGLHVRLTQLIVGHNRDLSKLARFLDEPKRAVDCFPPLFSRPVGTSSLGLATGEAIAHLHCLLGQRRISSEPDKHGIIWYQTVPQPSEADH